MPESESASLRERRRRSPLLWAMAGVLAFVASATLLPRLLYREKESLHVPLREALPEQRRSGQLRANSRVMLVGFGVGYSWGATLIRWQ